jgi:hypothetical protein
MGIEMRRIRPEPHAGMDQMHHHHADQQRHQRGDLEIEQRDGPGAPAAFRSLDPPMPETMVQNTIRRSSS